MGKLKVAAIQSDEFNEKKEKKKKNIHSLRKQRSENGSALPFR